MSDIKFPMKDKKKFEKGKLIKGRNEPCRIIEVCCAVSSILGVSAEELANAAYANSCEIFARAKSN